VTNDVWDAELWMEFNRKRKQGMQIMFDIKNRDRYAILDEDQHCFKVYVNTGPTADFVQIEELPSMPPVRGAIGYVPKYWVDFECPVKIRFSPTVTRMYVTYTYFPFNSYGRCGLLGGENL